MLPRQQMNLDAGRHPLGDDLANWESKEMENPMPNPSNNPLTHCAWCQRLQPANETWRSYYIKRVSIAICPQCWAKHVEPSTGIPPLHPRKTAPMSEWLTLREADAGTGHRAAGENSRWH